jgi:hypothetical protein
MFFVTGLLELAKAGIGFFTKSQEVKVAEQAHKQEIETLNRQGEIEVVTLKNAAAIARASKQLDGDMTLDQESILNMKNSYIDEILIIIFMTPIVLGFFPSYRPAVSAGFEALEKMPIWYVAVVVSIVVSVLGLRSFFERAIDLIRKNK